MLEAQQVPVRNAVPLEHTWDLTLIFPDDAAWYAAAAALEARLPELEAYQGRLSERAASLLAALRLRDELGDIIGRLWVYASQRKDSDGTDPAAQALDEKVGSLRARVSTAMAFINPEILALAEPTLEAWLQDDGGLKQYEFALRDLTRQRKHIRGAEVEQVLAQVSDITRAPGDIFEMLHDTDLQFPSIEDENGQQVTLSHARFGRYMESADRRVRRDAFFGYWSGLTSVKNTFGTTLAAAIRSHVFEARVRNYASALHAALDPNLIPVEVYHNLITTIEANLPKMHRYMALRKKLLGVDELHFYDVRAPLFPEADVKMAYPEARDIARQACRPLGADYGGVLDQAFSNRWIDVYENVGKTSGAYSSGSYSTPPYILLNYQDRLDDLYTLLHELGHSVHTYFTCKTQPFVYADYTTFLAEVASTLNEALLTDHLLKTREDAELRKRLIVQQLEDIRTTIFRQTMFATFELEIHRRAEAGDPLTTDAMSQYYGELVKRYHGPAFTMDDVMAMEWIRIPHFYMNFYVFQYATGLSAALALSRQIIREGQPAVDRYLNFLRSGKSRPSIDILRDAGVDMTTPEPVQLAMETFSELLDQLEALG